MTDLSPWERVDAAAGLSAWKERVMEAYGGCPHGEPKSYPCLAAWTTYVAEDGTPEKEAFFVYVDDARRLLNVSSRMMEIIEDNAPVDLEVDIPDPPAGCAKCLGTIFDGDHSPGCPREGERGPTDWRAEPVPGPPARAVVDGLRDMGLENLGDGVWAKPRLGMPGLKAAEPDGLLYPPAWKGGVHYLVRDRKTGELGVVVVREDVPTPGRGAPGVSVAMAGAEHAVSPNTATVLYERVVELNLEAMARYEAAKAVAAVYAHVVTIPELRRSQNFSQQPDSLTGVVVQNPRLVCPHAGCGCGAATDDEHAVLFARRLQLTEDQVRELCAELEAAGVDRRRLSKLCHGLSAVTGLPLGPATY